MSEERVELRAIAFATAYLEGEKYAVENVSKKKKRGTHRGYDLIARKGEEELKIEVKGCTQEWHIPDPFATEFDAEKRLVADFLYVVYFLPEREPRLCAIPRDAIPPEVVTPKQGYRIRGTFKNAKTLSRFLK